GDVVDECIRRARPGAAPRRVRPAPARGRRGRAHRRTRTASHRATPVGGVRMPVSAAPTAPPEVRSGLEGVVAFATTIAEPDREGGALRYRGVDLYDPVGPGPFE